MALLKKTLRAMLEHKAQSFGTMIMIMVSSLVFIGMNMLSDNLKASFDNFAQNNVLCDAEFEAGQGLDVPGLEKQFDASIEKSGSVDYELQPGQTLRIFRESSKVNIHAVLEGNELSGNDILIDKTFRNANNLKMGDKLSIDGRDYTIAGTMAIPNFIYVVQSKEEMINDPKAFGIAVMGAQDFNALGGASEFYAVRFHAREGIREQETALQNYLRSTGNEVKSWRSTDENVRVTYITLEVTTLGTMSKAMPTMMLLLSVILTGMVLRRMVRRESVIIGTLYAQGYRRRELIRHYLMYPLIITAVGGILGSLLGLAIVKPMLGFFMTIFPMPMTAVSYNYMFVLIGMILPVALLCMACWLVIRKSLRRTPSEIMKGAKAAEKTNFIERALKLERFKFMTKFQIREQVRSLSRTFFLLFGIIVATIFLLYGLTLQSSLDYMLKSGIQSLYNLKYEYVFHELHTGAPPEGTEQFNATVVSLEDDRNTGFYMIGVIPDSTRMILEDRQGRPLDKNQNIVTKVLADKLGLKSGDLLNVVDDQNDGEYSISIDAIANSYAGEFLFVPIADMNTMLGMAGDAYTGIWSDEAMSFSEGSVSSIKSIDAVVAGMQNMIDQTGILVYGMTISAFVLGLIIIYIVTGLIIEENRNTISLIKVLGYRKKEVNRLILNSNTFAVIVGYLIGIPVLLVSVTGLLSMLTESMQLTIPVKLNPLYMVFGFIIVILTYQFAKIMSRRKIAKISMSEALKAGTE